MQLRALRDEAEQARRDDARAVEFLEAAQARLAGADEHADATAERFAAALDKVGGRVVDLSISPPMLYTTSEGRIYEAHPVALMAGPNEPEAETIPIGLVS